MRKRRAAIILKGVAIRYFAPFVAVLVACSSDSLRASGTQLGGQGQPKTPAYSSKAGKGTTGSMPSAIEDDRDCPGRDDGPNGTGAKRQKLEPAISSGHAFSTDMKPHHLSGDRGLTRPPPSAAEGNAVSVAPTDGGESEKDRDRGGGQLEGKTPKRKDYLSWDEYFMSVAFLSAMRSKDPSTQVGACIVNRDNRIVGIGYNGFPKGCSDDVLPWTRQAEDELDTKYPYVCHAEMNAILNKNSADVKGCTIYVALFPCNECAKLIIQSGIEEVVYLSDKYRHTTSMRASRRLFDMSGVRYRQYVPTRDRVTIDFSAVPR